MHRLSKSLDSLFPRITASPDSPKGPGPNLPALHRSSPLLSANLARKASHPGGGGKPWKIRCVFQRAFWHGCPAGKQSGADAEWKFYRRGTQPQAFHLVPSMKASSCRSYTQIQPCKRCNPSPALGADGAPRGGFRLGWVCSSHMQPLQTQTALSPAGAEQVGLFIWEELICCRSIIFPPKPCAGSVFRSLLPVYII